MLGCEAQIIHLQTCVQYDMDVQVHVTAILHLVMNTCNIFQEHTQTLPFG